MSYFRSCYFISILNKLYSQHSNAINELCLISNEGKIIEFFSDNEVEKDRIATSIMATIALSTRAMKNLSKEKIKLITLKGDSSSIITVFTRNNRYLYINIKTKNLKKVLKDFEAIMEQV